MKNVMISVSGRAVRRRFIHRLLSYGMGSREEQGIAKGRDSQYRIPERANL